jgi:hypothetical protein
MFGEGLERFNEWWFTGKIRKEQHSKRVSFWNGSVAVPQAISSL